MESTIFTLYKTLQTLQQINFKAKQKKGGGTDLWFKSVQEDMSTNFNVQTLFQSRLK